MLPALKFFTTALQLLDDISDRSIVFALLNNSIALFVITNNNETIIFRITLPFDVVYCAGIHMEADKKFVLGAFSSALRADLLYAVLVVASQSEENPSQWFVHSIFDT